MKSHLLYLIVVLSIFSYGINSAGCTLIKTKTKQNNENQIENKNLKEQSNKVTNEKKSEIKTNLKLNEIVTPALKDNNHQNSQDKKINNQILNQAIVNKTPKRTMETPDFNLGKLDETVFKKNVLESPKLVKYLRKDNITNGSNIPATYLPTVKVKELSEAAKADYFYRSLPAY